MIGLNFNRLPAWPTPTKTRKTGSFKVDYSQIVTELEWELRHLGATQVILSTGHSQADIRADGWPYFSASKPAHPGVVLQILSRFGPLTFTCDTFDNWQNNLLTLARSLEQLRAVRASGTMTPDGEPYRAYQSGNFGAPGDGAAWGSTTWPASGADRAGPGNYDRRRRALLVLIREAGRSLTNPEFQAALQSEDVCRDIYRQAVLRAHPDTGGTAERFRAVMAAMGSLRDSVES